MSESDKIVPLKPELAGYLKSLQESLDHPPLKGGGGGGTSGGMDPWQTSVEKRLDSLDRRAESVDSSLGDVRERLVAVETKIDHLPSKGFIVTSVISSLAFFSALVLLADKIKAFLVP